ncbi:hypothetical protein L2744_18390 [Shewanella profunda]|uniref:hypothetical protein n=1 Tax=Shewanella profunda TaxID=254793 RepID=UPI00200F90EE|nr:hypothetical protein [Shewanella profunda]MCL1091531.1 hypothetical protein [Shewanella profunda]
MKKLAIALCLTLTACTSMNDALTPSVKIQQNAFDGSLEVIQAPVSAASSMSEAKHTLAFKWAKQTPDVIYLYAGVAGIETVSGLAFNVDGEIIDNIKKVGITNVDLGHTATLNLPNRSTAAFVISKRDFEKISKGDLVKMKVEMLNSYSVSSFGKSVFASINSKLTPFIAAIEQNI